MNSNKFSGIMLVIFLLAVTILIYDYYNGGWFCVSFNNISPSDAEEWGGEFCFQTFKERKAFINESLALLTRDISEEYTFHYTSDNIFINNFTTN